MNDSLSDIEKKINQSIQETKDKMKKATKESRQIDYGLE